MQKTHNKHVITGIVLGLLVLVPAILLAANSVIKGKDTIAPPSRLATSSSSNHFYLATGTLTGGENISIDTTRVDRLNRHINITVDARKMLEVNGGPTGWDSTNLQFCNLNITFPNGTKSFEMLPVSKKSPSIPIFYYDFVTNLSMPTGNYAIRAYPDNGLISWRPPLHGFNFTPLSYVQVYNHNPAGIVTLNETTVYRNKSIGFDITVSDPETPYLQLAWSVTLMKDAKDSDPVKVMVNGTWQKGSAFNQSYFFNLSKSVLGTYHFTVHVNDSQGGLFDTDSTSSFEVKDNPPVIHAVKFTPPLWDNTLGIFRVNTMSFTVNLTDVDNPWYWASVYVVFQRQDYNVNYTSSNFTSSKTTYNYTGVMNVSYAIPVQNYSIIITATDLDGGITYYKPQANNSIIVRDNPPDVHWLHINNQNLTYGLHVSSNEYMAIEINVTDIDQNLDYIVLHFYNTANVKSDFTFNITLYKGIASIIARFNMTSAILSTGIWNIYVAALDFDGSIGKFIVGTITVDPDTRDITAYVIGAALLLIAGFVVGGMAVWRYANSKIKDIRRDMIIKGHGKADQASGKNVVEKKMPPKAGKKGKYQ